MVLGVRPRRLARYHNPVKFSTDLLLHGITKPFKSGVSQCTFGYKLLKRRGTVDRPNGNDCTQHRAEVLLGEIISCCECLDVDELDEVLLAMQRIKMLRSSAFANA